MIKVLEIRETLADTNLTKDICKVRELVEDITSTLEANNTMNRDDYKFASIVFEKTRIALQKVNALIKIGGDVNG